MEIMPALKLVLLMAIFCFVSGEKDIIVPNYVVDLDQPPKERWAHVIADFASLYPQLMKELYSIIPKWLVNIVTEVTERLDDYIPPPYADEIRGIAMAANATTGETLLGNMAYDFTAFHHKKKGQGACTSILAFDSNGTLYHGRNLDYAFKDLLRNFTITVEFHRNGHLLFKGTTFAGLVGVITGVRPNGISITLDERDTGQWWENVLMALKTGFKGFVGFILRDTLADDTIGASYKAVLAHFSTTPMIAPCYIILGGVSPTEAAVITRDRWKAEDVWTINVTMQWFLVETNYDHWKPAPKNDDRRDVAINSLESVGQNGINAESMYQILSIPPVLSNSTSYTVVMSAGRPDIYKAVKRYP